jgi:prophage maintenance system killer protein
MINKKDLIAINQEVGSNGKFYNEDSIDFALSIAKQNKSWLYELSYMVRSLLVDHCFEDGNKRTAIIVIMTYFENNDLDCDKDKLIKIVWNIDKKNITDMSVNRKAISEHAQKLEVFDINKLMRMIKNAIVP